MSFEHEITFRSMGSDVRLLIGRPLLSSDPPPGVAAERERAYVESFAARLSRFRADSELSALNRDPRTFVPASPLLRAAVRAGLWAAERSDGLVDPTLLNALRRAGYESSHDGSVPAPLGEALRTAPPRRPARANPARLWRKISVDDHAGAVCRPHGVEIDTGGSGKGLCADAVAQRLRRYTRFVVDCGGDIAIGGIGAQLEPYEVQVEHPLTGETIRSVRLGERRDRHLGSQRTRLARRARRVRAPPARPRHRPACLDGAGRSHGARLERARGRDAVQDGPPFRAIGCQTRTRIPRRGDRP